MNKYDKNEIDKDRLKQKFLGNRRIPLEERLKNSEYLGNVAKTNAKKLRVFQNCIFIQTKTIDT